MKIIVERKYKKGDYTIGVMTVEGKAFRCNTLELPAENRREQWQGQTLGEEHGSGQEQESNQEQKGSQEQKGNQKQESNQEQKGDQEQKSNQEQKGDQKQKGDQEQKGSQEQKGNQEQKSSQEQKGDQKHGCAQHGPFAIPAGRYWVRMWMSHKFKSYRPLLYGVPGRSGILIHEGNTVKDTQGCILVGENTKKGMVLNSRATLKRLMELIWAAEDDREPVEVVVG